MTNYPNGFDNNITLPGVSGSSQEDMAITALRSAVFAVETELGITPSGIYQDVRTRLDILEARIQFGVSPSIPNDGYVKSPLILWNVPQNVTLTISDGYGAPTENRVDGSLYMRGIDGYANNDLYIRRNGQWYPIQTDQFVANCDLAGTYLCQEVIGIRNKPLNISLETLTSVQDGYHLTWNNLGGYWEAQTGFIPGHDLAAFSGPYGRTGQTVIAMQGFPISGVTPTDGYTLVWQASDNRWEPQARAVIFDGYVSRINLRSNRAQQSPILNTKTGIVNFGTSTNGSGGTLENYSTILGGDRNSAAGVHSTVISGFSNIAADGYSIVITGNGNTASGANSTVINGTLNIASGNNTTVSNGSGNVAAANFSAIFNGSNNTIVAGSQHSLIYSGASNLITGGVAAEHSLIMGGDNNTVNSANNVFIGTTSSSSSQGDFSVILSGVTNTIANLSDYTIILSGISNTVTASSEFSFIGSGNSNTVTGHYASILTADTCNVNALHGMIINGANNTVTGQYTTILNGNNNTATGSGWGLILDGYNNNVGGTGSFIADGYNNTVNGQFSSILNGNFNTISGRNSTILNGGANTIDSNSIETTVITGDTNTITNSSNSTVFGSGNTYTNAASTFIIGTFNNVQSTASFINGSTNILSSGTSANRIFGSNNTVNSGSTLSFMIGNGNQLVNSAANVNVFGSNNIADGYSGMSINGPSNISNAALTNLHGQFGKARMFGQEVRANSRFTQTTIAAGSGGVSLPTGTINVVSTTGFPANGTVAIVTSLGLQAVTYTSTNATQFLGCTGGTGVMSTGGQVGKIGEAQWSRLILTGKSASGASIPLQLQDTIAVNPTFVDGYSYDMSIKLMIVNTNPIVTGALNPDGVVPARYYIDVLAHQEGGILSIDNINFTVSTPNTKDSPTRTPWTFQITTSGNQLLLTVDSEAASSFVQPGNTASDRRAIATIDMREMSRI